MLPREELADPNALLTNPRYRCPLNAKGTYMGADFEYVGIWLFLLVCAVTIVFALRLLAAEYHKWRDENKGTGPRSMRKLAHLEKLASLRDCGAITSSEFEIEKAKIMR